jgi:integrase/recombinase XerC
MAAALAAFERHLRAERSLSPHTVRAYAGDVRSLLEHASCDGVQEPGRSGPGTPARLAGRPARIWCRAHHAGQARRGSQAFTAFAHRRGWLATDPGPRLGTPKTRRALPHVLRQDEMRAARTPPKAAPRRPDQGPGAAKTSAAPRGRTAKTAEAAVALRDAAMLELRS